jgi:wyosine [tRNA(Phe)-imidazoG37] synthetase (radical SAM superfamily)
MQRREYCPVKEILVEVEEVLREHRAIDYITFSGAGEPTLNSKLGELIHEVKKMSGLPVAVITNGTLLFLPEVRKDLLEADVVLPSLDAVSPRIFRRINRPHPDLRIENVIEGLKSFRREFRGQIWLEILLVKGLNDQRSELEQLRRIVRELQPDKIQLNTVVRPPAESDAEPVGDAELRRLCDFFGDSCEVIAGERISSSPLQLDVGRDDILAILSRRAMTLEQLAQSLTFSHLDTFIVLGVMEEEGLIESFYFYDQKYYRTSEHPGTEGATPPPYLLHLHEGR